MARSELTLGFVGSGKVEKRNAYALLRDLIDAEGGNAKFIFPLTKSFWNEALQVVSQFAVDNGIPVEAIVDDSTAKTKELKSLLAGARRQHQSTAVPHKLASLLEEARNGKLIVLWDDEDEAALDTVREADSKGIDLLELTRGLDRIELVSSEDGEDEELMPASDEIPEEDEENESENDADEDETAGQEESDEEIPSEEDENDDEEDEPEAEEEFPEAEAEDDLDAGDEDGDDDDEDEAEEFPEDEGEEEFSLPEEDEADVAVLDMEQDIVEEVRQVSGMSEFQRRLLAVLENTSNAFVKAIDALLAESGGTVPTKLAKPAIESKPAARKAVSQKPAAARPAKKVAAPVKKAAKTAPPAKKATAPVKRTVPAKKAAPAKASSNGGGMSKAQAQKIIDAYRPRRGRPPADVTEARKVLGLA
ncbi:MAG TPA: hypothetical protein VFI41_04585 [Gemmatimonadales bacterium]|nr:hypothetical protein [Gemmatimonadales bacterium]